jgi:hypothetical protein
MEVVKAVDEAVGSTCALSAFVFWCYLPAKKACFITADKGKNENGAKSVT